MSTRSGICRITGRTPLTYIGRYHHSDGYPTGLGKSLWNAYRGHFANDLSAMMKYLIDEHPAGWSTVVDADFTRPAGYFEIRKHGVKVFKEGTEYEFTDAYLAHARTPKCYCHGDRSEEELTVTEHDDAGEEWVYAFDEAGKTLMVIQKRDTGDVCVWEGPLDGPEPNWHTLERS